MKQIKVGIPCQDMMHSAFAECLVGMAKPETVSMHPDFQKGTIIYVGRENIAMNALRDGSDYVLWLDSDMAFHSDALVRLYQDVEERDCDIVTGLCFMRRPPYDPCIWSELRIGLEPVSAIYRNYPRGELFEVDATGLAFALVKVDVIKSVLERYGTCFNQMVGYGEDISFCIRAKQCGYKIWCDSRVKIGHIGLQVCDESLYDRYRAAEVQSLLLNEEARINDTIKSEQSV